MYNVDLMNAIFKSTFSKSRCSLTEVLVIPYNSSVTPMICSLPYFSPLSHTLINADLHDVYRMKAEKTHLSKQINHSKVQQ